MRVHSMALAAGLLLALLLVLTLSDKAAAQASFDTSTIDFLQPEFAQHLINGQHERVEIQGLGGLYYGMAAYLRGIGRCPALMRRSPEFLVKIGEVAAYGMIMRVFETRLKMDEAADATEFIGYRLKLLC